MTNHNDLYEDRVSWKEIGQRWIILLRLLSIVFVFYFLINRLNPYVKEEHVITNKIDGNFQSYDMQNDGSSAYFNSTVIKDDLSNGDYIWVYYKKNDVNGSVIKVKKMY